MGYDEKHAAERAAKRIKTEKIIAATAGLTVAAASAYVIKHHIEEKSDHIIKSGKTLQRVAASDDINFDRALYMAGNKSDKAKYAGLYGRQLRNQGAAEGAVKAFGIKATKDLKQGIHLLSCIKQTRSLRNYMTIKLRQLGIGSIKIILMILDMLVYIRNFVLGCLKKFFVRTDTILLIAS